MSSLTRHEGYLHIDNRFGPGTTAELVQASGKLDAPVVGEGRQFEAATVTCPHCHRIVILNPDRTRARGYCAKCDHYLCDACDLAYRQSSGVCRPLSQVFDELQDAAVKAGG